MKIPRNDPEENIIEEQEGFESENAEVEVQEVSEKSYEHINMNRHKVILTKESLDNISRELSIKVIRENNLPVDIEKWSETDVNIFSREISKLSYFSN